MAKNRLDKYNESVILLKTLNIVVIKVSDAIYIIHAATKKKQAMDRQTVELLKQSRGV